MAQTATHMGLLHHTTFNKGTDMGLNAGLKSRMR